jgi:hypothetical protein
MATDFRNEALKADSPASDGAVVTPNDSTDLPYTSKLYIGGTGNLRVTLRDQADGDSVTLSAVPVGFLPLLVKRVWATSTTATNIVALY